MTPTRLFLSGEEHFADDPDRGRSFYPQVLPILERIHSPI